MELELLGHFLFQPVLGLATSIQGSHGRRILSECEETGSMFGPGETACKWFGMEIWTICES